MLEWSDPHGDGMSSSVRPRSSSHGDPAAEYEAYRRAALEARAQAEALRRAVVRADALVHHLEELVESLLAILEYPKAYGWPPLPHEVERRTDVVLPDADRRA
jgi:hypothetical protein